MERIRFERERESSLFQAQSNLGSWDPSLEREREREGGWVGGGELFIPSSIDSWFHGLLHLPFSHFSSLI